MDQKDIYFRAGGQISHCGVECLPGGRDIERIVIDHIEFKESEKVNGRTENGVWVAYFAPNEYTQLPLILNVTNRRRLVKLYPECDGFPARLHNVAVRLTKEKTRDPQEGGECWGLRISKLPAAEAPAAQAPPAQAQRKVIQENQIQTIVDWAKNNKYSFEQVAEKFDFASDTVKQAIIDALDDMPA